MKKTESQPNNDNKARNKKIKHLIMLIGNTIIIFAVYRLSINFDFFIYVMTAYMVITTGLALGYVIYNRGFSRRGITADMLPDSMSYTEKCEFIEDGKRRLDSSKWMLTLIIPFIFTFAYELLDLFAFDYFKGLLNI